MDTPEPALIASEDGHVANVPSHPTSQHFDDSLFLSEQLSHESVVPWDSLISPEQHAMDWLPQSEDHTHISFNQYSSGQVGTDTQNQMNIWEVLGHWNDFMDLTPSSGFENEAPKLVNPVEPNTNLLVGAPDVTCHSTSKPRRVLINDHQKAILTEWIVNNPYPSRDDRITLAHSTGLTMNQVSNWFTRTRQRTLKRIHVTKSSVNTRYATEQSEQAALEKSLLTDTLISTPLDVFQGFQPSSASLPEHYGKYPIRKPPKRSRSLPPFSNTYSIYPYIYTPSILHDRLSLDSLGRWKWPKPIYGLGSRILSYVTATKREYIKTWVADVAQHAVYPFKADHEISEAVMDSALVYEKYSENRYLLPSSSSPTTSTGTPIAPPDLEDVDYRCVFGETWEFPGTPIAPPDLEDVDYRCVFGETWEFPEASTDEDLEDVQLAMLRIKRRKRSRSKQRIETPLDGMSSTGSSASSSATSASSYISFGPRKGRRVAFQTHQLRNDAPISATSPAAECVPAIATVPRKRRATRTCDSEFATELDKSVKTLNAIPEKRNTSQLSSDKGDQNSPTRAIVYTCTFCFKEFSSRFPWKRHETSAHAPQVQWVCGRTICSYCPICSGATVACTHRFDECWKKPISERVFFRKDALKQHIRVFHCRGYLTIASGDSTYLDECRETINTVKYDLTCHFCGFSCETWEKRELHLIEHFNDRIPSNMWIPGGPYVLTRALIPHGSATCHFPVSEIADGYVGWRCPLHVSGYSPSLTINSHGNVWECSLCGLKTSLNSSAILHHLESVHNSVENSYELPTPCFSHAKEFIEHLITCHSAERGGWMAELLRTALQRMPHTD
ncbi:hypothetical protein EV127DRAFT_446749 [Xylaria flabelliformis]|nr:hypothetical protein EV127DRAFT_446749 [Xylaria flabelliformis]